MLKQKRRQSTTCLCERFSLFLSDLKPKPKQNKKIKIKFVSIIDYVALLFSLGGGFVLFCFVLFRFLFLKFKLFFVLFRSISFFQFKFTFFHRWLLLDHRRPIRDVSCSSPSTIRRLPSCCPLVRDTNPSSCE